jgi:hypothetical protein
MARRCCSLASKIVIIVTSAISIKQANTWLAIEVVLPIYLTVTQTIQKEDNTSAVVVS